MLESCKQLAELNMKKAVDACEHELSKIRTGRAHPGILEGIRVDYYGSETPLKNIANLGVSDARTLTITPWDRSIVKTIEKAIIMAGLGLNPINEGDLLRIPVPPLTEERRKEFVKLVKSIVENGKVSVRNVRREVLDQVKIALKNKEISEDMVRRVEDEVQKITDRFVVSMDRLGEVKEQELMTV